MWRFDSDTDAGYWERVDSPTTVALRDVTSTVNGPVAVGDKGIAVGRGRERWGVILENGPGAKGRALYAVDTSDDGKRVWFAGAGGAFGYYDIVSEERRDYSVPRGNSNGFYSLAVAGERGSEKFLVGDGSGHVLPGHMENDEADWSWSTTPSGGNAVQALCHDDDGYGYAVTANANVFMTTADDEWERVGIDGAQNSFYACSFAEGVFLTGGGGGLIHEADNLLDHDDDVTWTPTDLGGFAVYGLDAGHGAQLACGENGNVHIRMAGGDWEQGTYERSTTFNAGLVEDPMIVVGDNGLIVERRNEPPGEREDEGEEEDEEEVGSGDADEPKPSDEEPTAEADVATDDGWDSVDEADSGDGDTFDGLGENHDGDGNPPEAFDEQSSEQVVGVSTDTVEPADDSDGGSGDSGNDPADEPDDEDTDPADEPDEPDGEQNDVSDDSGNDQSDPPDENTDSDADSPDS